MARTDGLVVEDVGDEVLVYDQRNDQAHCLSRDAAMVWRVCDGRTSPAELATALSLEVETVDRAIAELESCGLFDHGPVAGITRRQATAKMAKVGVAAASAPMIYSIMAPTPALAASQNFCLSLSCTNPADPTTCCQTTGGCGTCHKNGCACCGPGNSTSTGENKICTADCSCTNCTPAIIAAHCQTQGTTAACNTPGGTQSVNTC